jgi:Flp pilus assembly protein TadG
MSIGTKRDSSQKGQAMMETALVFTAVICMLLFVVDMGRLLFLQQYFAERARAGARWAAVNTYDPAAVANWVCSNDSTNSGTGLFGLQPSNVSVSAPVVDASNKPVYIRVTISGYQTVRLIPYIAGSFTNPPVSAIAPAQSLGATN